MTKMLATDPPTGINEGASESVRPAQSVLRWPDVLRCLQTDKTRSYVLHRFRACGFSASSWWRRSARRKMAELLTAAEDGLEHARACAEVADRVAIRTARRRLEQELWP